MTYDEKQTLISAIKNLEDFIGDMPFVFSGRNKTFDLMQEQALFSLNVLKAMAVKQFGLTI
jgi:hypothetical protein